MNENTDYTYWLTSWAKTCDALRALHSSNDISSVANDLALIAGDYHPMSDDEVLATFINEQYGAKK